MAFTAELLDAGIGGSIGHRARGATHYQALRTLANRLVGILHGCLKHHTVYDENLAWHSEKEKPDLAA